MNTYHVGLVGIAALCPLKMTCFILGYFVVAMGRDLLEKGVKGEFHFRNERHVVPSERDPGSRLPQFDAGQNAGYCTRYGNARLAIKSMFSD